MRLRQKKLVQLGVGAIVCMDDFVCSVALQVLAGKKIQVPQQIQIASFYDSTLLKYAKPAITSLWFDDRALGALTCKVLLQYIRGDKGGVKNVVGL